MQIYSEPNLLLNQARDRAYWHELNPEFSIGKRSLPGTKQIEIDGAVISSAQESLRLDGYFHIAPLFNNSHMDALALGVRNIRECGWPAPFAAIYDEYWQMFYSLGRLFNAILGNDYQQIPNLWCWYVEANYASKGWGPHHRDRPAVKTVRPDGSPNTLTVWIPLTDATVLNSCIYLLPARFDPNYPDNLQDRDLNDPQNIRALPANKGSILGWTETVLHWGSRSSDQALEPRISMAFTYQRADVYPYEMPLFDPQRLPGFEERLGLIGQNIVKFQGHDKLNYKIVAACEQLGNLIPPIQEANGFDREVLDSDKRLSKTCLRRLQAKYFAENTIRALQSQAQYTRSMSEFKLCAEMVLAFLLDYADHLDTEAPLYILDLAGEMGCFAVGFLTKLLERQKRFSKLREIKVHYLLTAGALNATTKWAQIKSLDQFRIDGILDFAVFDPEQGEIIDITSSNKLLRAEDLRNPLIVIANHLFGSLAHDGFRFSNGTIQETRFTIFRDARECDLGSPIHPKDIRLIERYFDCPPNYYGEQPLDSILDHYRSTLGEASILFPIGAMRAIANLLRLSNHKLVLIATDKGSTSIVAQPIRELRRESFCQSQSFSFDVNFDAIARYCRSGGGKSFLQEDNQRGLCIAASFFLDKDTISFEHLEDFFSEHFNKAEFINSINIEALCKMLLSGYSENDRLNVFHSILRILNFDPAAFSVLFTNMFEDLKHELQSIDAERRSDLVNTLNKVANTIYPFPPDLNALDCLFRFYIELQCFDECLSLCLKSLETFGPEGTILDHCALCYEAQGKFDLAYQFFRQSLEQSPDHEWARAGLERTQASCE